MGETVPAEVLTALTRGVLILTDKERTARLVRRSWDQLQIDSRFVNWEPARVLSWRSWTHLLWRRLLLDERVADLLLSRVQEQRVWKRVLASDPTDAGLRSIDSLGELVADAWHRLCAYEGQQALHKAAPYLQSDASQFARWSSAFEKICRQESLLSAALLEAELARRLRSSDFDADGRELLLLGFDRVTPAQDTVVRTVRSLGGTMSFLQDPAPHDGVLAIATNEEEELRGCARWIRERLRERPDARVGVIVNDLTREMETIDSVLREHLSPELGGLAADREEIPYEFSLGRSLSSEPMVHTAQDLLRWAVGPLALTDISHLLLSPHFAFDAKEISARAEFDVAGVRKQSRLRPEVTIKDLLRDLQKERQLTTRLRILHHALKEMEQAQVQADLHARSFGDWSEWIRAWLARSQWVSSTYPLSSREYQLHQRWERALDDLATLDFSGDRVTIQDALATLDRLVHAIIFAPESRGAPVQILGPLEAAGERFDAIWVLRAGELTWPPHTSAVTLLPWSLQRDLEMPGVDSERERDFSRRLTCRLAGCAGEVVFSYARVASSQAPQSASSVVRDLELRKSSLSDIAGVEEPRVIIELERLADITSLPALLNVPHRGGARILELQAACGFRAFAELRLGSVEPRQREIGMDVGERGSAVHTALEHFWSSVGSQQELRTMSQNAREELIRQAIVKSFEKIRRQQINGWDEAYLETQETRLATLLTDWIGMEIERPEFTVVAREEQAQIAIGPLELSLRMDRVDLVDGQQVILDYKTGSAHPSAWLGDRPDLPQVPLYALLASDALARAAESPLPLGAVGFARVRAGEEMELRGFEASPGILLAPKSGTRPIAMDADDFKGQVERWREVLERLANEFAQGDARVRPKQYPTTCERCGQRLLCRLDASSLEQMLDDQPTDQNDDRHG